MNIVFFGTPDFAAEVLQGLIKAGHKPVLCVSQPDKPQGRKQIIKPTPVHEVASQHDIDLIQPRKIKTDEFYEKIKSYEPDFIVTAAYGRLLPDKILDLAKYEAVNVHGSLLPKYRGASPVQAALLAGDTLTGISILRMTAELDAGPVFSTAEFEIPDLMRTDELMLELAKVGADLLPGTLDAIYNGDIQPVPQDDNKATFCGLINKEMGQIDWDNTASQIEAQVRGLYPWPGAYTYEKGNRFKIHLAKAHSVEDCPDLPNNYDELSNGTVVSLANKSIWVKTASGLLQLLEVQKANSKAMKTSANYHNYNVAEDTFTNEP